MPTHRTRDSADFKAKLALEVLKGNRTLTEIASDAQAHPDLLMQWNDFDNPVWPISILYFGPLR